MAANFELNPPLGIDLGTTFSAIARWNGALAETYDLKGNPTLQSVVYYEEKTGRYVVGKTAYDKSLVYPENGIVGVKRSMDNRQEQIKLGAKDHSPIEISAKILEAIHGLVVEKFPSSNPFRSRGIVVTVPYYFKAHQCANTREAAELAGLNCVGILQEPIAASLQYALQIIRDQPGAEIEENILVFDLGGGTFDLTLFRLTISPRTLKFEVLASAGDDRLGGLDFDEALVEHVLREEGVALDSLPEKMRRRSKQKLLDRARFVKETLSDTDEEWFVVDSVVPDRNIERVVTRPDFERAIDPYLRKVERCTEDVFLRAGLAHDNISRVIKVGGSSRIPVMTRMLCDFLGGDKVYGNIRADLCIAEGAAIYAAYLDDREVFGRDIEIATRTCHALGVEVEGGMFHELIAANRKSPYERSHVFEPTRSSDAELAINVYQGSSRWVKDNTRVGTVVIPREGAGWPDQGIVVTFKLDEEQMLTVKVQAGEHTILSSLQTA